MEGHAQILVVDDQEDTTKLIARGLEGSAFELEVARTPQDARRLAGGGRFDLCILSLDLGPHDSMKLLADLHGADCGLPIIVMADPRDSEKVTAAIKAGAYNWVPKVVDIDRLTAVIDNLVSKKGLLVEPVSLEGGLREEPGLKKIVGDSAKMRNVFKSIEIVVGSDVSVLIQGATGTGKELVAKAIHYRGPRRKNPFYAVNCAALPENLLESELFGHERGAFTGAVEMRKGKFELAHMGTLFLDEIGEMSPMVQAKILRVLEENAFERVGGSKLVRVDVRVVSATNKDLRKEVKERNFREDLYYRLAVYPIVLPPLSERPNDIPQLAEYFIQRYGNIADRQVQGLSESAKSLICRYGWPGNVRQLQNCIRRAILLSGGSTLEPEHFDLPEDEDRDYGLDTALENEKDSVMGALQRGEVMPLHEIEGLLIKQALTMTDGNITEAADKLGISRSTIYRKMQEHGVGL